MSQFLGIARHEFNMSIRRPSIWVAYGLLFIFYAITVFAPSTDGSSDLDTIEKIWGVAGRLAFAYNWFMPLLAGILSADRMQRDTRSGLRELQSSSPLQSSIYVLSKYLGVLFSVLIPMFIWAMLIAVIIIITGHVSPTFIVPSFLAYFAITVPAYAFVVAFSLACPLVMPLRVYQVLFTGYWFWGNFLSANDFPTISSTLLNAAGIHSLRAFFDTGLDFYLIAKDATVTGLGLTTDAILNILVLAICIAAVLFTLNQYLRRQARQA